MRELNLMTRIVRNPEVVFTQIDNEIVLVGPKDDLFYGVNEMGAAIWRLLDSSDLSCREIFEHIKHDYEIDESTCISDIMRFIGSMLEQNIVIAL